MFLDLSKLEGPRWPLGQGPVLSAGDTIRPLNPQGPFSGVAVLRMDDGSVMRLHGSQIARLSLAPASVQLVLRVASPFPGFQQVGELEFTFSTPVARPAWTISLTPNGWFINHEYRDAITGRPGEWLQQLGSAPVLLETDDRGLPLEKLGLMKPMRWSNGTQDRYLHIGIVADPQTAEGTLLLLPSGEQNPYEPSDGLHLRGLVDAELGGGTNWRLTAPVLLGRSLGVPDAFWLAAVNWMVFPEDEKQNRIDTPALLDQIWNRPRQHALVGARLLHAAQPALGLPRLQLPGDAGYAKRWLPPLFGFRVSPHEDADRARAELMQFHLACQTQPNGKLPDPPMKLQAVFDWQADSIDPDRRADDQPLRVGQRLVVTGAIDTGIAPWKAPWKGALPAPAAWLSLLQRVTKPPDGSDVLARWSVTDADATLGAARADGLNWLVWGGLEFGFSKGKADLVCQVRGSWTKERSDLYLESVLTLRGCRARESASTDEVDAARLDAQFGVLDDAEDRLTRDSAPLRFLRGMADQGRNCDLVLTQRCYPGRNAVTRLLVRSAERSAFGAPTVVLQTRPFFVAQTEPPVIEPEAGDLLASWASNDPEGAQWRVPDSTVSLLLPPQAVGEAMERGARFWRVGADNSAKPWIDPARPILYRFSPPTRLEVRPSLSDRRYNSLPGNLGAVLRNARVTRFTTEMVYPLRVDFQVDEQGLPDLRIGETAGFLGRPAENLEPLPDYVEPPAQGLPGADANGPLKRWLLDAYSGDMGRYAAAWVPLKTLRGELVALRSAQTAARSTFAARLAQFHVYDPWSPQGGLGLAQQLSIRIRDTALGAPPLLKPLSDWKLNPDGGEQPTRAEADLTDEQKKLIEPFLFEAGVPGTAAEWGKAEQGSLPAGVLHTIEFASELVAVLRNPVATSGRIDALAFSALGASGHMSASFDEGRTTFIAETSFGQLSRLVKIRIGRLGVLWNKARHVIVYERTTVSSLQFMYEQQHSSEPAAAPPDPVEKGDSFGWPILRKTQEYVEPIEVLRAFGSEAQKDKNCAGFIESSEVVTPRIYVNGAWGRDLGDGYEIPLWNAQDRTGFYPRPQLALRARAGGDALTRCWLREPEHLVFYSSTAVGTGADTNLWAAVNGVDCPAALARMPMIAPQVDKATLLNSPSIVAPRQGGLRRPRFDLAVQADGKVDLQHGRGDTQMLAAPEVLSVMRSAAAGAADLSNSFPTELSELVGHVSTAGKLDQATRVRDQAERALAKLLQQIALATGACEAVKTQCGDTIKGIFKQARTDLAAALPSMGSVVAVQPGRPIAAALDTLRSQWLAQEKVLRAPFERAQAELDRLAQSAYSAANTVSAQAQAQLASAREMATAAMAAQRAGIDAQLSAFTWGSQQALQTAMQALADSATALSNAFAGAAPADLAPVRGQLQAAQKTLVQLERHALLGRHAAELNRGLTALANALGEADEVAKALWGTLGAAAGALAGKLKDAADKAAVLAGQLDQQRTVILGAWDELAGAATLRWDGAEAELKKPLRDGLPLAMSQLRQVHDAATVATGQGADLIAGKWRNTGNTVLGALGSAATPLDDLIEGVLGAAVGIGRAVAEGIAQAQDGLQDTLGKLEKEALGALDGFKCSELVQAAEQVADTVRQVAARAEQALRERATEVVNQVLDQNTRQRLAELEAKVRAAVPGLANQAGEAIKLVKAFGELPALPTLTFNAERAEYLFDDVAKQIETSPFAAKLREIDGGLKALGLAVPARQLLDQIIPDSLKGLDFGSVFRQFGGMDFQQLLQRFKLPDLKSDQVRITQGVDKATRTAWIAARVNADFPGPTPLFEIAGVSVSMAKMNLKAASDLRVGLDGQRQATTDAALRADWGLNFGGAPLATFHEVAVRFDGSKFGFDIEPGKIELHPSLKFVDEFAKRFSPKLPPAVQLAYDGRGMPRGARANLVTELSLPPLGAIAIGPLRIASGLALTLGDDGAFDVTATLSVGSQAAPVWVQIGYLGGGMWLEAQAAYLGKSGQMVYRATVGVGLGCIRSVGFASVAYGSFALLLFVQAEISNAGGVLRAGLSVNGSARILGICNASVYLLLEAVHSGGRTRGHGVLDVSVDICWCYTLHVRREVEQDIG